jgi:hypothetical protein
MFASFEVDNEFNRVVMFVGGHLKIVDHVLDEK